MTLGIRGGFRNPLVDGAFIIDGSIDSGALADGAVITAKLANLAVEAAKLGNSSVTAVKIANLAVGTAAIANLAVTNAKITDLAVDTAKIADLAVSNAKIANLAVSTAKIADLAVSTAKIANLAVTDAKINTLSATKITAGTIDTGTITVNSLLKMAAGADIQFVRNSAATISTNDNPQNGDVWIEYRGNDAGAIIGMTRASGVELVAGQINVGVNGFEVTSGVFEVMAISGGLKLTTTADNAVVLNLAIARPWEFRQQGTGVGAQLELYSTSNKNFYIGGDTVGHKFLVTTGASGSSSIWIDDALTDVGNHETLRLDRGTGGTLRAIGFYSSTRKDKREIVPLSRSKLWKTEWFDQLEPVKYRRRSTQGREFGFVLDDIAEVSKYLTTKGDSVGHSLDEFALLAVTVDAVKDLRSRVRELESDLDRLRRGRLAA